MSRLTHTRGRGAPLSAALVTGVLLAGCGGSGGLDTSAGASGSASPSASPSATVSASETPTPTTTTTSAPAPTSTVDPAVAAVAADWRRYRAGYVKGIRTRNERVPDLVRYASPKQQAANRTTIRTMRARNIVLTGRARNWLKDVTTDGRRATLRFCQFDSSTYYVYAATGRKVVPVKDTWRSHRVRLIQRDGRWRVDSDSFATFPCQGAK